MKKFKNWCNENSGFLAFWAIIIAIIIAILQSIDLAGISSNYFFEVSKFLNRKVSIPLYLLITIVILLATLFRNKLNNWNFNLIKSTANKIQEYVSDESTFFIESTSMPQLNRNTKSYAFKSESYWDYLPYFEELRGASWIAHTNKITDKEAIEGGKYTFLKSINIKCEPKVLSEAFIYFLVDDYLTLRINNESVGKFSDYKKLNKIDIRPYLKKGNNEIKFIVENVASSEISNFHNTIKGNFGEANPYGLKYKIRITY